MWLLLWLRCKNPHASEFNCNNSDGVFFFPIIFPTLSHFSLQSFLHIKLIWYCFILSRQNFLYIFHQTEDRIQSFRKIYLNFILSHDNLRQVGSLTIVTDLSYQLNSFASFPRQITLCVHVCMCVHVFVYISVAVYISY